MMQVSFGEEFVKIKEFKELEPELLKQDVSVCGTDDAAAGPDKVPC